MNESYTFNVAAQQIFRSVNGQEFPLYACKDISLARSLFLFLFPSKKHFISFNYIALLRELKRRITELRTRKVRPAVSLGTHVRDSRSSTILDSLR